MNNNIHYISIKNNEIRSSDLILKYLKEKKIIYIYKESNNFTKVFSSIKMNGPAIILQSSGSINKSKLCIHPISNLNRSAESLGEWLKEQGFNLSECLIFNTLPLNHISGFMPLWRSQVWGSEYINISPDLIKKTKELKELSLYLNQKKKRILITSLVPTQLIRLLKEENGKSWLKMFAVIWVGGAQISNELFETCKREKIRLAPCYGSTETAAMVSALKPKEFLKGYKNYGTVLKDIQLRINMEGIIEINSERIGYELESSSRIGYFKNKTGWWESGDYGKLIKINNSDYLIVIGRKDNAFQSGGETIFPDLIKSRINEFISDKKIPIKHFLISKIKDDLWENRFLILVNFKSNINQKEQKKSIDLLEEFTKNFPKHERPMQWIITKDNSIFIKEKKNTWKNNF